MVQQTFRIQLQVTRDDPARGGFHAVLWPLDKRYYRYPVRTVATEGGRLFLAASLSR